MSSTSSPIGLAILGAGIFAKEAHLPALAELAGSEHGAPKFALRAVYSRSEASAESLAASAKETLGLSESPAVYFDVKSDKSAAPETSALAALLGREDVQGVIVVLPITLQPDVIRQALAAGKSVLSEKPVGPDVAAGVKLIGEYRATYEKKGIIWRVAENFEAEPSIRAGAKAIADGKIGDIRGFAVDVAGFVDENSKYWKTPWRTVPDYQGGFLLDGGVHFAAAIRTLLPSPLVALSGHASLNKKILAPQDTITASIRTASGAHGTFRVTFATAHPQAGATLAAVPYIVSGSKGWLKVESGGGKWKLTVASVVKKDGDDDESPGTVEENVEDFGPGVGVREEIGSWLKALAGQDDGLGLGNPSNTLKDVAVIQAALNSKGSEVDLVKLVE